LARRAIVTWGTSALTPKDGVPRTEVFLMVTEETGKAVSYPLGTYDGVCSIIGPIAAYGAMTAISCVHAGVGYQLHAVGGPAEVLVLRMAIVPGENPDPFRRDEITSIPVSLGTKIEAGPP